MYLKNLIEKRLEGLKERKLIMEEDFEKRQNTLKEISNDIEDVKAEIHHLELELKIVEGRVEV